MGITPVRRRGERWGDDRVELEMDETAQLTHYRSLSESGTGTRVIIEMPCKMITRVSDISSCELDVCVRAPTRVIR